MSTSERGMALNQQRHIPDDVEQGVLVRVRIHYSYGSLLVESDNRLIVLRAFSFRAWPKSLLDRLKII